MINKKCIDILNKNGYKVFSESNYIFRDSLMKPIAYIVYDPELNTFGLLSLPTIIYGNDDINKYTQEIASILSIINELNIYNK